MQRLTAFLSILLPLFLLLKLYYYICVFVCVCNMYALAVLAQVRGQLSEVTSLLSGWNSGWQQVPLPLCHLPGPTCNLDTSCSISYFLCQ